MASSRNSPSIDAVEVACAAVVSDAIAQGQHLVVALSGGVDSVVMLDVLQRHRGAAAYSLSALHVNHGLSANSEHWEDFCRRLCDQRGVPLSAVRVVVERNSADGLENAARRVRHQAFAEAKGDRIVLGHHRGDQAETLLFNLVRGTGLVGAAAMAIHQRRLLRPLLGISRNRIEVYARARGLTWVEDESNRDTAFSRNFLRHDILEPLRKRFPGAEKNLAAAARRFGESAQLLDELAELDLGDVAANFPFPLSVLAVLSERRARNLLRYLLARSGVRIPSEIRLVEILRQLLSAAPDRHPRVRFGDWDILRRRGMVELVRAD
ncbi:MAG: tRNA lysidine(34) synthetase TilS [Gammaproteobacteria bacterium]|nr:tRNA lysidine(34) synthetase TilS [Gammaproteobacteria bacterium]MBU1646275.1 tRNA lysidine(34) synthetase TilS [Gammaproteobacteria bacterium]MBU1970818.1 tRNA lysidine(34) synthetase TilS [Gammaproteobacteria bacterium]